jgi:hypothetical protein
MLVLTRFALPGVIFLATLASGFWLSHAGKPLNTAIFTVHKLIALAAVVATVVQARSALANAGSTGLPLLLLAIAGLGVVALFITGALMSLNRPAYALLLTTHNIAPAVALAALGMAIYLLSRVVA